MKDTYWSESATQKPNFPMLQQDTTSEVVVIGAGITGITTAYLLNKTGKKVILIDKGEIYSGETSYTTAFLSTYPDTALTQIKNRWDIEKVKWVLRSQEDAIQLIENISTYEKIECEFMRTSVYGYTLHPEDVEFLKEESEVAREAGFNYPFKTDDRVIIKNHGYIEFLNQAKFHPLKYLVGLTEVIKQNGVQIFENTKALEIETENTNKGVIVKTETGNITTDYAVIATHNPFGGPYLIQNQLIQRNTYVIYTEIQNLDLEDCLYWDTEDPYNYIRVDKTNSGKPMLAIGGGDHDTGGNIHNSEKKYQQLENYLKEHLPQAQYKILYKWSGQVIETTDGLPFIGFLPENNKVLVATGFAGTGITFGTISARIITDLVTGKENQLTKLYPLARVIVTKSLFQKLATAVKAYTKKYFGSFETFDESSIKINEGKIVETKGKKIAVYKNREGKTTKLSASCTHLGCLVNWNSTEKTWDCPCHGSRFNKKGEVITGPAKKPLPEVN